MAKKTTSTTLLTGFKVSTKRFTLSDSSVNSFGFRMLTSGAELEDFIETPLMLFMHERSGAKYAENISLPIGIWTDIQVNGDVISAVPAFDEDDEFAMQIYGKVEKGILKMASIGADPLEESNLPEHLLPTCTRPTITKWRAKEASICDIGANRNALALYDKGAKRIELNASNIDTYLPTILKTENTMIKLTAPVMVLLSLAENHSEAQLNDAILKLAAKADAAEAEKTTLAAQLKTATDAKEALEVKLTDTAVEAVVGGAVAAGKITEKQKPKYVALAKNDLDGVTAILNEMPGRTNLSGHVAGNTPSDADAKFLEMSWDAIDKQGKLGKLKSDYPEAYAEKFKEKFGK
jgi:Mu-like prophage I protein